MARRRGECACICQAMYQAGGARTCPATRWPRSGRSNTRTRVRTSPTGRTARSKRRTLTPPPPRPSLHRVRRQVTALGGRCSHATHDTLGSRVALLGSTSRPLVVRSPRGANPSGTCRTHLRVSVSSMPVRESRRFGACAMATCRTIFVEGIVRLAILRARVEGGAGVTDANAHDPSDDERAVINEVVAAGATALRRMAERPAHADVITHTCPPYSSLQEFRPPASQSRSVIRNKGRSERIGTWPRYVSGTASGRTPRRNVHSAF